MHRNECSHTFTQTHMAAAGVPTPRLLDIQALSAMSRESDLKHTHSLSLTQSWFDSLHPARLPHGSSVKLSSPEMLLIFFGK